jgi:hypothetical protein
MELESNVVPVAFCPRRRGSGTSRDPDRRCDLCGASVQADGLRRVRHLVCTECIPITPRAWLEIDQQPRR